MADTRNINIWVGDWKSQLKAQNNFFTSSSSNRMNADELKRWHNYDVVGRGIYKQFFPQPYYTADELSDAGAFFANSAILREREATKTASRAASSASAAKAASEAAKAKAAYERAMESAKDSAKSAGQAAAAASKAAADYESRQAAKVAASTAESAASASKAAAAASKAAASYERKQAADQADQERAAKLRQQEKDDLNAKLLEAQAKAEQAQIDAAKAEARASQYESSYTSSTPYYDYTDTNTVTTTETAPADNTGRNVLIICGIGLGAWWLLRRRKKRGRA